MQGGVQWYAGSHVAVCKEACRPNKAWGPWYWDVMYQWTDDMDAVHVALPPQPSNWHLHIWVYLLMLNSNSPMPYSAAYHTDIPVGCLLLFDTGAANYNRIWHPTQTICMTRHHTNFLPPHCTTARRQNLLGVGHLECFHVDIVSLSQQPDTHSLSLAEDLTQNTPTAQRSNNSNLCTKVIVNCRHSPLNLDLMLANSLLIRLTSASLLLPAKKKKNPYISSKSKDSVTGLQARLDCTGLLSATS